MKLCKDCKHYRLAIAIWELYAPPACMAPAMMRIEPVEGRSVYRVGSEMDPRKQRESGKCGMDAVWFEPRDAA